MNGSCVEFDDSSHHIVGGSLCLAMVKVHIKVLMGRVLVQVSTVPQSEFVFVRFSKEVVHVTQGIVRPSLTNVQVLNERARVSTPELLRWDQSAWWHHRACSYLGTIFYSGTFKDHAFVANHYIIANMARVKGAIGTNSGVSSNEQLSLHTSWERWSSVQDRVLSNGGKLANLNLVDISSNNCVVPDRSESPKLDLANNSGGWCNPIVLSPWGNIVQVQLHLMLRVLFNSLHLRC